MSHMDKERRSQIEAIAYDLLTEAYGSKEKINIPVDIGLVLKSVNLTSKFVPVIDPKDSDIIGAFDRERKMVFIKTLNNSFERQLFTLAHELGHFVLHEHIKDKELFRRQQAQEPSSYKYNDNSTEELEANAFAASVLMPIDKVRYFFSLTKNTAQLAEIFGVSLTAMHYRLVGLNLNYIEPPSYE